MENSNNYTIGKNETKQKRGSILAFAIYSMSGLMTIFITVFVDFILNRHLTWSLYPLASIIFVWLCLIPILMVKKNKLLVSFITISILIVPYLFVIAKLTGIDWFYSIGLPMSIVGIVVLWIIGGIYHTKLSVLNKVALTLIVMAASNLSVSYILGRIWGSGYFDIWNILSAGILVIIGLFMFCLGLILKYRTKY